VTTNADLAKWGEPPASASEQAQADLLHQALDKRARCEPVDPPQPPAHAAEAEEVLQTVACIEQLISSVLDQTGASDFFRHVTGDEGTQPYEPAPPTGEYLPDPFPGELVVRELLGEGATSKVWLADDLGLGIAVALKTLRLHGPAEQCAAALEVLRHEARILARLEHPNIVRVHGLRQAGGEHYLVLQYVAGGSLQARLKREGPLPWRQAARYVADVGEALLHVHACGLVHRDIKPANILWNTARDEALLTDFGLAARLAGATTAAGTLPFMAPEVFAGQATPAGDVYSLAATLFHLLTGELPFPAHTPEELLRQASEGLPDPDPRCAAMPEALERLVRLALAEAPERRPELAAFVRDLRGTLNQLLADNLVLVQGQGGRPAPVDLRVVVARADGRGAYTPVAATTPPRPAGMRNLVKVPPLPGRLALRTGDRVRVEVVADRDGFVTVFNVGPTGDLSLLHPETPADSPPLPAHRPLPVLDVAVTPPAGRERLFAVWSRVPPPLPLHELFRLAGGEGLVSPAYRATRNLERVQESVQQLRPEDWHAVVLELDHVP
jgi:hypothetical protein